MKPVTINELKKELAGLSSRKILDVCLRLAKYKKENKELLTYLLFESTDEEGYIKKVKEEIDLQFEGINKTNIYFIKKGVRKGLRIANKHIKYSGNKQSETEILIYFCRKIETLNITAQRSTALSNLFDRQIQRIRKVMKSLHEDLQYDLEMEYPRLKK